MAESYSPHSPDFTEFTLSQFTTVGLQSSRVPPIKREVDCLGFLSLSRRSVVEQAVPAARWIPWIALGWGRQISDIL